MSEKREYDAALGGDVVLENHVQTYRYANAALKEIRTLMAAVKHPATGTKLIFQTLPKHIRRRAMSHHPKRLPRKYRNAHIAQMAKSGKQRVLRRPSRKHRRRPSNLLQDYLRRQRRLIWLETHIWHARRFHMVERWGYRLPLASCDKTYKACYRATADHCLVQDISFYNCIELYGKVSCLYEGFKCLSNKALTTFNGLSIKAVTFLNGLREGSIDLFRNGRYPEDALCRAMFMWRPTDAADFKDDQLERTLWLWVHPTVYSTVLDELIRIFDTKFIKEEQTEAKKDTTEAVQEPNASTKKQEGRLRFTTKNLPHTLIRHYLNSSTGTKLTDLNNTLNRFRLTGPLSQSVLAHAFKTKELGEQKAQEENLALDWFQELANDEKFQKQHNDQAKYWRQCEFLSSPAAVRPNMILALNIVDPRLQRPAKRTKARPETDGRSNENCAENNTNFLELLVNLPTTLAQSPLWDEPIRQQLQRKMLSTHSWCLLREKNALVPGAACAFENLMQSVPVLLVQRPGLQDNHKRLNYGCGWDIIAPAGYGMPIWLTLIMWGAKAGGLRELQSLAREMGTELQLPDTIGGRQMATDKYWVSYDKYFRLPPGKRHNYRKLAIVSPFRAPWAQLLRDWLPLDAKPNESAENKPETFYIERDKSKLLYLNKLVYTILKVPRTAIFEINSSGLIPLQLRMKSRGNIGNNALICIPTSNDIIKHYKCILEQTHTAVYTEPLQPDLNKQERKTARLMHKKQLKRLRARRTREKRKLQETSSKRVLIRPANTASLVRAHFERMSKLWLPDKDCSSYLSVRKQCSRETFGYVTEASFSFTNATVCGIGYVTLPGLQKLLKLFQSTKRTTPMCLLRDVNSQHYYFASFEISQNP